MKIESYSLTRAEITLLFIGFIGLVTFVFIYNRPPFYDEDEYLNNVAFLRQFGFSKMYLTRLIGSAGPLYSIVHYVFSPFTHLQAPYIRLVNLGFLLSIIYFLSRSLELLQFSWTLSLNTMAIPLTYLVSGLALTEVPAMFFMSIGIYLSLQLTLSTHSNSKAVILAILAGICLSLGILGRQPYLLVLSILPILILDKRNYKKSGILLLLILFFSLALPCCVFALWNGLVPPMDAVLYDDLAKQGIQFRPDFFVLCLYHYAIILVLIAPGFYVSMPKKEIIMWIIAYIIVAALNFKLQFFKFVPFKTIIKVFQPDELNRSSESLGGAVLIIVGLYFLITLFRHIHKSGYRKELVFYSGAALLIALACTKITWGFDPRYAAQAIPFLIPLSSYFYKRSPFNVLRILTGFLLGLKMIHTLYIS